jgi:Fe2+ transport system protein B
MTGAVFIPLIISFGCLLIAFLEHRERRRQEAELDRLRALLAARNGHAGVTGIEWDWAQR